MLEKWGNYSWLPVEAAFALPAVSAGKGRNTADLDRTSGRGCILLLHLLGVSPPFYLRL